MNQKKKLGKRIAAWFMCLAMVISIVNLPALTMDVEAVEGWVEVSTYAELKDALKAADSDIKLTADIKDMSNSNFYTLEVENKHTLDLAGHTITRNAITTDKSLFVIKGSLILTNSERQNSDSYKYNKRDIVANLDNQGGGYTETAVFLVNNGGKLIVDGMNDIWISPLTIEMFAVDVQSGGTFTAQNYNAVYGTGRDTYGYGLLCKDGATMNIYGGAFLGGIDLEGNVNGRIYKDCVVKKGHIYLDNTTKTISDYVGPNTNVFLNGTKVNTSDYSNALGTNSDLVVLTEDDKVFTMEKSLSGETSLKEGDSWSESVKVHNKHAITQMAWRFSEDGENYAIIPGADDYMLPETNVSKSGYYQAMLVSNGYADFSNVIKVNVQPKNQCGDDVFYTFNQASKTLTLSGTGTTYKNVSMTPWASETNNYNDVEKIVVEEGVTALGECLFQTHFNLSSVILPSSLEEIGAGCFQTDEKISELIIPPNVSKIKALAFASMGNSTEFVFLGDAPQFHDWAFSSTTAIVKYPAGNDTWNEVINNQYEGIITWVPDDHRHYGIKVDEKNSTCSEFGVKEYYKCSCTKCFLDSDCTNEITDFEAWKSGDGKIEKKNHIIVNKECTICHVKECVITGIHDFSNQPYHATDDKSKHYQECKDCGEKSSPVDHTEVAIPAKEATCKEAGLTEGKKCSVCGTVTVVQTEVKKLEHTWDAGKVTKEPTKDASGEKTYTCTKCGETKVEVIDKLPDDIKPSPSPSPDPDKPTPDPTPVPSPDPVKPLVPEISVKGKFDVAAAVKTVSDKKPVAYVITTGNKKAVNITKKGILTAKKAGEIEITAYADKKKTDEITKVKLVIKDTKVPVKDTISYMDDTCDLKSKITNLPLGVEVKFSISEKQQKIATVDAKTGIITPVKDGKAKVTVEIGEGKNAAKFYTTITVKTPKFSSSKPVVIKAGNSKPLALKNVKSDDKITWSVSDKTKAEIIPGTKDSKIKVKGIAAGRVTLTADVNGHKIIKEIKITE